MSPRRCTINGCKSISGQIEHQGVTFHTFPLNAAIRKTWMTNCKVESTKNITKSVLVCSRHFRRADFQPLKNNKYFLKQGAVPTIFPWGNLPYEELPSLPATTAPSSPSATNVVSDILDISSTEKAAAAQTSVKRPPTRANSFGVVDKNNSKQRSASAEEQSSTSDSKIDKAIARKSLDSATTESKFTEAVKSPKKRMDLVSSFTPGDKLEAQDFHGTWHPANVVEVDHGDREVFINFEKGTKSNGVPLGNEWISMDSSRLRPLETGSTSTPIKDESQFKEGDKCLARWTDSRKFRATIQTVLENNMYEVLFDDGFKKVVKGAHITKLRKPAADAAPPATPPVSVPMAAATTSPATTSKTPVSKRQPKSHPIPKFDMSQFDLPIIPSDGEWCCEWVNDTPIGREGYLHNADGNKRPTVLVDDWRLPTGWAKHLYQRSSVSGKWDVVLVGPNNKRFRSKNDVKVYLEEHGLQYNPDVYDFSIHKRRAKDIGVYVYTKDYVPPVVPKPNYSNVEVASPVPTDLSQELKLDPFPGFSPIESLPTILSPTASALRPEIATPPMPFIPSYPPLEEGYIYVGGLKVQLVDNLFRCPQEGCNKNFRKENHLQIHIKHYHKELSALLGVCPNMTELAYFRTMGTPIEETTPKNQIPNIQFFEKSYQSDQAIKPNRRTLSPDGELNPESGFEDSAASISQESLKRKSDTDVMSLEPKDKKKLLAVDKLSEPTVTEAIFSSDPDLSAAGLPTVPITTTPIKKSELLPGANKRGPKSQVHRFKIGKGSGRVGRRKGSKNLKKKFKKVGRRMKPKPLDTAFLKRSMSEPVDYEDAIYPFSIGTPVGFKSTRVAHRTKRLKLPKYASLDSANIMPGDPTHLPLDENGDAIKIVHMRQEEIINCLCSFGEEDGLMIQCELCLCWQHGGCNGIDKESDVPDKYVCYICRNPTRGRESMKYIHDQDWLYEGKLPHANYHQTSKDAPQRFEILKQSHMLTGNLLDLKRSLHSLNVKINIASNKDHPKLYLWSKKWEQSPSKNQESVEIKQPKIESVDIGGQVDQGSKTEETEKVDKIDFKSPEKSNETAATSEATTESTPTIARKKEEEDAAILGNLLTSPEPAASTNSDKKDQILSETQELSKQILSQLPPPPTTPIIPEPEAAIDPAECQLRLLEHIQKEQNMILSRMQTIDAQIIALEAMDERNDSNSNADFARTSQTIHMLLNDLAKLKKLAIINKTTINANTLEQQYV